MRNLILNEEPDFINESTGILQNLSTFTLEVSTTDEFDNVVQILPHQFYFFSGLPIYARCPDGAAKARVINVGVNLCSLADMNSGCGSDADCCSCGTAGNGAGNGIETIIIDNVEQLVNDNVATLDLSDYLKGHETVTRAEVRALFR